MRVFAWEVSIWWVLRCLLSLFCIFTVNGEESRGQLQTNSVQCSNVFAFCSIRLKCVLSFTMRSVGVCEGVIVSGYMEACTCVCVYVCMWLDQEM